MKLIERTPSFSTASISSSFRTSALALFSGFVLTGASSPIVTSASVAATLKVMARHSNHHGDFARLCAHICRECAAECNKHDHEHCKQCAAACEKCAAECDKHASEADA